MADLYRALGIGKSATAAEITSAYRAKAKQYHPDAGGCPYGWIVIQKAFDTLIDEQSRAAYDGVDGDDGLKSDSDDQEGDDSLHEHDEPWYRALEPFDLLAALGVRWDGDTISGGGTRCRACFYKLATRMRPASPERYSCLEDYSNAVIAFRRVCLAFVALRDSTTLAIYRDGGFERLRQAESYQEHSMFDHDPIEVVNDFFNGTDPGRRSVPTQATTKRAICASLRQHPTA